MQIRHEEQPNELNILCVGEQKSSKTTFLRRLTQARSIIEPRHQGKSLYKIFANKINKKITYFHELSEVSDLYLQQKFNGMIYFVDLVEGWRVDKKILQWVQLYAHYSGEKPTDVPVLVVVTKVGIDQRSERWKKKLQIQLERVVATEQIYFWISMDTAKETIKNYCKSIVQKEAKGIKQGYTNYFKMFGLQETLRIFIANIQYYFIFGNRNDGQDLFIGNDENNEDEQQIKQDQMSGQEQRQEQEKEQTEGVEQNKTKQENVKQQDESKQENVKKITETNNRNVDDIL